MYLAGSEEISRNKDDRSRVFPCERSFSSVPNPSVLFKWQIGYFTWHFIFRSLAIWCLYEFCMVFWTYYLQFPLSGTLDHCSDSTGFDTLAFLGSRKKIEVCFSLFLLPGGIRPDYMTFLPPIWSAGAHWNWPIVQDCPVIWIAFNPGFVPLFFLLPGMFGDWVRSIFLLPVLGESPIGVPCPVGPC